MTIGTLAKNAGVGVETVRFYERKGILKKPQKPESGFRSYTREDARKIQFIRRAQELGFTLREIRDILGMEANSRATCTDLKSKAEMKLSEIERKIRDLRNMKRTLERFAGACGSKNVSIRECGILECFSSDWKC